jgi:hypothetical protein
MNEERHRMREKMAAIGTMILLSVIGIILTIQFIYELF